MSFVVPEGYLPVKPGDENVTRFVPLIYDSARKDLARMARMKVGRIAVEKVGPVYRGVFEAGADPFIFSMSGQGVFTAPVRKDKRAQAWQAFQDLLDNEYKKSVEALRSRNGKGAAQEG